MVKGIKNVIKIQGKIALLIDNIQHLNINKTTTNNTENVSLSILRKLESNVILLLYHQILGIDVRVMLIQKTNIIIPNITCLTFIHSYFI